MTCIVARVDLQTHKDGADTSHVHLELGRQVTRVHKTSGYVKVGDPYFEH